MNPVGSGLFKDFRIIGFASGTVTPVQLSIPDVLTALQSGLVETVYNSFYGSIVLQWFTKARYTADFPYGYA